MWCNDWKKEKTNKQTKKKSKHIQIWSDFFRHKKNHTKLIKTILVGLFASSFLWIIWFILHDCKTSFMDCFVHLDVNLINLIRTMTSFLVVKDHIFYVQRRSMNTGNYDVDWSFNVCLHGLALTQITVAADWDCSRGWFMHLSQTKSGGLVILRGESSVKHVLVAWANFSYPNARDD